MLKQLPGYQKAFLRRRAQQLHPLVTIGRAGYTTPTRLAVEEALLAHELIKLKFLDANVDHQALLNQCAQEVGACLIGVIGRVGILYRPAPASSESAIRLLQKKRVVHA
jgi:RNA-binding protein